MAATAIGRRFLQLLEEFEPLASHPPVASGDNLGIDAELSPAMAPNAKPKWSLDFKRVRLPSLFIKGVSNPPQNSFFYSHYFSGGRNH